MCICPANKISLPCWSESNWMRNSHRTGHVVFYPMGFVYSRCLDQRHATCSAFKGTKVRQVATRRFLSEPHDLGAAWAKHLPWRVFIREFVAHGQSSRYVFPTLGKLSEPAGNLRDSRHLLKLSRKKKGRVHWRGGHALDTFV